MNQHPGKKFSVHDRIKSFVFAFAGIKYFFTREHNARIHGVAALMVLALALILPVSARELIALLFSIALVVITEMFNTAIEKIMDHLSPAHHPDVKVIKDLAAAAVLIAAIVAFITGLIIFTPKFL